MLRHAFLALYLAYSRKRKGFNTDAFDQYIKTPYAFSVNAYTCCDLLDDVNDESHCLNHHLEIDIMLFSIKNG